ncbi:MAG: hypothetical protein E7E26_13495, partial [Clostridiales bacterium]|nr:hypothetical protein [Clostridiales bacterium]
DDHHADQHNGGQSQAESPFEVSHLEFLLLNFRADRKQLPAERHISSEKYDSPCTPNFVRKIVRQNEKSWLFRLKGSNGRHLVDMRNRQSSPPLGGQGFERFFGRHLVDML